MLLLELAAQAVRGFSPSVRVALKPGYVGLKSPTDIPAPLAGLLLSICYPDGRGGDAAFLAPGAKGGRAGLSLQGQDQNLWRIVRDLGGAGGLHKMNRATNQYEVVSQDAAEMGQVLRATVGFPARTTFEQVFTFTGNQLPTRRPKAPKGAPAPAKGKAKLQSAFDQYGLSSADEGQTQQRIAALESERATAKEAAELQFKMDGIQADIFKYESRLKAYGELKGKVDAARAELATAPTAQSLGMPDDIVERVKRFGEEKKRRDDALAKVHAEREQALKGDAVYVEPLYRDRRFVFSFIAGLALLVGAAFLEGGARYLSLLSIPAFTMAALVALRYVEELQHQSRESAKAEVFTVREKKIHDEFQLANSIVQTALEKTEAVTVDEFLTAMGRRAQLQPAVAQLELEFADMESDPEIPSLPTMISDAKAEQEQINQRLLALSGGYVREVREIERDLAKLKETLAPAPAPKTEDFAAVSTAPAEVFDDPVPAVLLLGTDLFATDVPTLWSVLKDRTVQYLTALTDRRYHGMDVDKDGRATVQAPGRAVPAGELPGRDLDLLYLSLRLTLIEKYSVQTKLPVIIEDSFGTVIDATKQGLFGRMLKHIGSLTQILHVTGVGQNAAAADAVVAI